MVRRSTRLERPHPTIGHDVPFRGLSILNKIKTPLERYGWREWLCHTNFSFLVGASHPDELVTRAAALGYRGLAITDYDGVYGIVRAYRALQRLKADGTDNGLRLFYGAEIHVVKDHALPVLLQDTLVLVARSHRGYFHLCRILSHAHRAGKTAADVPLAYLAAAALDDVVAIQPMRGPLRLRGGESAYRQRCEMLQQLFKGRFYLGLSRHLHPGEDFRGKDVVATSRALGIPCLLTQDAFFDHRDKKPLSDLLHAIRHNRSLEGIAPQCFPNGERSLHPLLELERRYKHLSVYEEALAASEELATGCHFDLHELKYTYPQEMLPAGLTSQEFLAKLSWEGAQTIYQGKIPAKVAQTVQRELELIAFLGFADYFLTIWDIVSWARQQRILCHGRGSAANSAVCFVLGITSVNPDQMELLFERFISVERGDPPDIDVDFEHERREEVIQYIYARYGREQAAMVANVITFCTRGAMRSAGKALGIPENMLEKAAAVLESREYRHAVSEATVKEVRSAREDAHIQEVTDGGLLSVPWELWAAMADQLKGFPRHLGIHSGGFMLASKPLDWLVPQEPGTMDKRTVIQWCKEDVEALGFFKIDILALGILTALRKMFSLLKSHHGVELEMESVPQDDQPTYAMIQKADTVGTFQIESRAQMSMLPRLKPKNLYDLVIEVAIIRPGPIQGGMIHPFLRRRNGKESPTCPDPRLEAILKRTLGVPIFQEQVMRIAMAVGGFSAGESNELRRHMGSFSMKGDVSGWIAKLEKGMRANGISEDFIAGILGQMKGFAHYGFPESHAAAFAQTAYVSSYLKCHYPAVFFVALINSQPMGFYPPHVLLQTARHLGIRILPVCVLSSDWESTLEGLQPPYAIRMGLHFVTGLRSQAAEALVERRQKKGAWADLEAFARDAGSDLLVRRDVTALAAANALHVFGVDRRAAIWLSEAAPFCKVLEDVETPLLLPQETRMEAALSDLTATRTTLGDHFALIVRQDLWCYAPEARSIVLAKDVLSRLKNRIITVFGWIMVRQAPPEAKGFMFMTLEDETGLINLVFNPRVRESYRRLIDGQSFLCVTGRVECDEEALNVMVSVVHAPEPRQADIIPLERGERSASEPLLAPLAERELAASRNYR